jgi:aspartate-semialdehyde dehydrogenase
LKKLSVGILGSTGVVGRRFVQILENHPWFNVEILAASDKSANKTFEEALGGRWNLKSAIPKRLKSKIILDSVSEAEKIANQVDFVFSAIGLDGEATRELEYKYALAECPVISNNSAHRQTPDIPVIIPELNPGHAEIISFQRKRLGTRRGFIAAKPNCSIQCFLPVLFPLKDLCLKSVAVCTYQAISGAGKTFETFPEIIDNVIPFIQGEEKKTEEEPLKILGSIGEGKIIPAVLPEISAQCVRVPVSNGHMAAVFAKFENIPSIEDIIERWENFSAEKLPGSPEKIISYFSEENRPQTRLERNIGNGMGISVGRLRKCSLFDIKFICVSHNAIRGAAGGGVLLAELLFKLGYLTQRDV